MEKFQESLVTLFKNQEGEADHYFGMYVRELPKARLTELGISLRELIHEFKWQTLVLFKCALLQPKVCRNATNLPAVAKLNQMLFFGSSCERLCMMQFALISLIPGLIRHLQDAADPKFNACEENLVMPTSLRSSERASC